MTQKPKNKGFTKVVAASTEATVTAKLHYRLQRAQDAVADLIPYFPQQTTEDAELGLVVEAGEILHRLQDLLKGAEPAWMADVRAAQARIEHARVASRKTRADQSGSTAE